MIQTRIRPARQDERGLLLELWERSVRGTHGFLHNRDLEFLRPLVRELLSSDAMDIWVLADGDDVPIGFLGLDGDDISALFLEPCYRRQGGGRQLVEHAQALRGGALTVDVNEQNISARRFYEALGFVQVGRSAVDDHGLLYPVLHLRRAAPAAHVAT